MGSDPDQPLYHSENKSTRPLVKTPDSLWQSVPYFQVKHSSEMLPGHLGHLRAADILSVTWLFDRVLS